MLTWTSSRGCERRFGFRLGRRFGGGRLFGGRGRELVGKLVRRLLCRFVRGSIEVLRIVGNLDVLGVFGRFRLDGILGLRGIIRLFNRRRLRRIGIHKLAPVEIPCVPQHVLVRAAIHRGQQRFGRLLEAEAFIRDRLVGECEFVGKLDELRAIVERACQIFDAGGNVRDLAQVRASLEPMSQARRFHLVGEDHALDVAGLARSQPGDILDVVERDRFPRPVDHERPVGPQLSQHRRGIVRTDRPCALVFGNDGSIGGNWLGFGLRLRPARSRSLRGRFNHDVADVVNRCLRSRSLRGRFRGSRVLLSRKRKRRRPQQSEHQQRAKRESRARDGCGFPRSDAVCCRLRHNLQCLLLLDIGSNGPADLEKIITGFTQNAFQEFAIQSAIPQQW